MCLAVPGVITEIEGKNAKVDYGGTSRWASIDLVDAQIGDYVMVHAGFAIQKINEEEARKTLALWKEMLSQGE